MASKRNPVKYDEERIIMPQGIFAKDVAGFREATTSEVVGANSKKCLGYSLVAQWRASRADKRKEFLDFLISDYPELNSSQLNTLGQFWSHVSTVLEKELTTLDQIVTGSFDVRSAYDKLRSDKIAEAKAKKDAEKAKKDAEKAGSGGNEGSHEEIITESPDPDSVVMDAIRLLAKVNELDKPVSPNIMVALRNTFNAVGQHSMLLIERAKVKETVDA